MLFQEAEDHAIELRWLLPYDHVACALYNDELGVGDTLMYEPRIPGRLHPVLAASYDERRRPYLVQLVRDVELQEALEELYKGVEIYLVEPRRRSAHELPPLLQELIGVYVGANGQEEEAPAPKKTSRKKKSTKSKSRKSKKAEPEEEEIDLDEVEEEEVEELFDE